MQNVSKSAAVAAVPGNALREAEALLEQDRALEALARLEDEQDASGEVDALRGVAQFRAELYGAAVQSLRRAVGRGIGGVELQRLLERAVANEQTGIATPVPAPYVFERQKLLGGPKPGEHPSAPASPVTPPPLRAQLVKAIGQIAGTKFGEALQVATRVLGSDTPAGSVWTTWYRLGFARAIISLARRRDRLNRKQIFAAYSQADGTAFFKSTGAAPAWAKTARTADGSYNDLQEPMAGAAGTRFGFNTDPHRTFGETGERLLTPNPRTVSRVLMTRIDGFKPIPFLNLNAASWIQFMNHDWVSYGDPARHLEPYRIPLDADDPARRTLRQSHMLVHPTQGDPTARASDAATTHINEVTSWWDGSQIYGSDADTARALRSYRGGKLAMDAAGEIPVAPDGVEATGFRRNWWVGLSMLHTLFCKEHNAICDMLAVHYPRMDDQQLYDTARLINAAVMAKIHTVEWTPAVLPNRVLNAAMNSNWYGFLTNLFRSRGERKTLAEINVADPIAGGLVGNATDNHGVPYSLTREFTAVYRLHSLLPDLVEIHDLGSTGGPIKTYGLAQLRQAAAPKIVREVSMARLFYSFGRQHPGLLVLNNFPETLQNLSIPGAGFYDLGAVDVLRDRERGVPRYNQFRRLLGLHPISRFEDLTDDGAAVRALKSVYASVEDIDLLVGNLAESHRPEGFGFGETLFEVFILNASRRLQADRFFTESYREDVYTSKGLEWIDRATFKSVLIRHYPELQNTGLANVDNAFEPWDVGVLEPSRHPLRQFERELAAADQRRRAEDTVH